ncbi:MAG TPA: hypothetical protein DF667_06715 [Roseburia sp.]|uniref:Uncharacterized protein n=1 Tax=Roseburia hominis TaxID=301301 RepID=A0A395VET2_9FIRM|nr:hypothetical protein DWX93_02970 [Roseburia hominis]HBD77977.1 hypothetical protein [Roseburia sp.]HCI27970.1 hypothetical protein [Roseburia sp.]HCU03312.1 hypothetical protein [Roseburia sp.]
MPCIRDTIKKSIAEEKRSSGRGRVGVFDCVYIGKTDVEQSGVCPAHAGNSRMYVTVGETDALFYCE